jgi:hypothetical protein
MNSKSKISNTAFCLLVAGMIVVLFACDSLDSNTEKFNAISIGDSRESVIAALGEPDSLASIEMPIMKLEQMAWHSSSSGRVYTVFSVLDRVVGKTIIQ